MKSERRRRNEDEEIENRRSHIHSSPFTLHTSAPPLPLPPSPALPSRTRVLFLLGSFGGGGAERQTIEWLRHLDRGRFEPVLYVISRAGPLAGECPDDVPVYCYEDRVKPSRFYIPGRTYRKQVQDLRCAIDEVQPDRLVSITLLMTLLAAGLSRPWPRWFAVEMADPRLDFVDQIKRFRTIKKRRLREAYMRAKPVAVSEGVREGLAAVYNIPVEWIAVVPNTVDVEAVQARAREAEPDFAAGCFYIAAVGRLQPQKGYPVLLEAVRILVYERGCDSVRLQILGEGPQRGELERFVGDYALQPYVAFRGFHPNPPAVVSRCDLFCLSSVYEGLPLALLEAMACGTPVVATDCPSGPGEVLNGGRFGGLVPVNNPGALADVIEKVINDRASAQARAEETRRHVSENYSIAVAMGRWEELLGEGGSSRASDVL